MANNREVSILIIDDEEPIRRLLALYLSEEYTCVTAASAEEGMALMAASSFNLVMTDIKMPNMTGLELIAKLRQELGNRTVPIVIISTKGEETDIQRGMSLGANEYLLKPISTMRLKEVITRLLG